jgi:D-alanyl-D-alanine carboxypeptidase
MRTKARRPAIVVFMTLAMVGAGCSSSDGGDTAATEEPPTTEAAEAEGVDDNDDDEPSTTTETPTTTTAAPPDDQPNEVLVTTTQRSLDAALGDADGGVALLWRRDGVTLRLATGVADDAGAPMDPDQNLRVGSISKPFVATMVMQLRDEGAIDLDQPLAAYLPGAAPDDTVTVRELLAHRSGVVSYTDQASYIADAFGAMDRAFTTDEILAYVDGLERSSSSQFSYSNTNYILLGLLIEAIDGTTLEEALQRRITGPLDLDQTRFATATEPIPAGTAGGWSASASLTGAPDAAYTSMASSAWAAGSLVSSVDDLATYLDALFQGGLVSEAALAEMTDVTDGPYGLGLFAASLDGVTPAFGHNGLIPGFSSTMAFEPGTGDLLVVLTNNDAVNADVIAQQVLLG